MLPLRLHSACSNNIHGAADHPLCLTSTVLHLVIKTVGVVARDVVLLFPTLLPLIFHNNTA